MSIQTATAARYAKGSVILHWLIALLIAGNFVAAWVAEDMPKAERMQVMGNHKAIGLIVLALTVLRIVWRLMHKAPPLAETLKAWEVALAKLIHAGFYLLMLGIPLAGWGLSSAFGQGKPVSVFGLFDVPALPVGSDKPTIGMFHELHEIGATLMLVLIGLHVARALKHRILDKDRNALLRMTLRG